MVYNTNFFYDPERIIIIMHIIICTYKDDRVTQDIDYTADTLK